MIKTTFIALLSTALLSACASKPQHMIIAPQITSHITVNYQAKVTELTVTDLRPNQHIAQILRQGEAAELYSSQEHLANIVDRVLNQEFKKHGLMTHRMATNHLSVNIDQALISVTQETLKYQAKNNIVLTVKVSNNEQNLTKTFTIKGNSEGPLTPDLAVLERDFNQQLATLLTQILNDTEIQSFIR